MTSITRAALADVEGIRSVVQDIWGEEILPDACQAQIEGAQSAVWVAKERTAVLGFVSAFVTVGYAGRRRWEVDLLAVRRASQGLGLGQRLIQTVCQDVRGRKATLARAAIRVDNGASQRAFEKVGFSTDGEAYHLLLWPPDPGDVTAACPEGVSLLPVDTLTYRGLWIEGLDGLSHGDQRSVIRDARAIAAREKRLNTGALIAADKEHLLAADVRDQAKLQAQYYWFVKPISETQDVKS